MSDEVQLLHELDEGHPDRNKLLVGCYYRWYRGETWNQVKQNDAIAKYTYNELTGAWTYCDVFAWNIND